MTSRQHQDWLNHGKPDSGLVLPLQLLANTLAAAGYTVYVYPNDAHLDDEPPQDHTYYSETGWPKASPKWWRHAIDIMPPTRSGLPSLQTLGQRIFDARQSGRITWLKYMNWPSTGDLSRAVQDSWKPNHVRSASGDAGHIHLSSITGVEILDESYNPLTSVVLTSSTTPGDDMAAADDTLALVRRALNGFTDKGQPTENLLGTWIAQLQQAQATQSAQLAAIAAKVGTPVQVALSDTQIQQIAAAVTAHPDTPLGDADVPAVVKAIKQYFAGAQAAS